MRAKWLIPAIYILFLLLPIYWLLNMSLKTNSEILSTFSLWPQDLTLDNYRVIFTDASWYSGYINSMIYVSINVVISLCLALPAAYAFSRYSFVGDKHLFFWLLTNRMAPPAVFALPFFQLYSSIGLFDTHIAVALAHCLFNLPLAVWILEGFMSGIPKEIDETAFVDGYSWPRFFIKIFIPQHSLGDRRYSIFLLHVLLGGTAPCQNPYGGKCQTYISYYDPHRLRLWSRLGRTCSGRCSDHTARSACYLVRP